MDLPSPQATPMNACPGLRPRWCPRHIAKSAPRTAAFRRMQSVGFPLPLHREIILMTTTTSISGLNTQPAPSIHPASYSHCWVCTWTSLLTCRLHFDQVGLELQTALTHWVTLSNLIPSLFKPVQFQVFLNVIWIKNESVHNNVNTILQQLDSSNCRANIKRGIT